MLRRICIAAMLLFMTTNIAKSETLEHLLSSLFHTARYATNHMPTFSARAYHKHSRMESYSTSWRATYSPAPLISVASRDIGRGNFTGLRGPWCAAALNHWLARSGHRPLGSNRARDFASYGRPSKLQPGAILVWKSHVGVYAGNGLTLSGNGRGHRVHLGRHSLRGIIAIRKPV
jgi:hypothetical protein